MALTISFRICDAAPSIYEQGDDAYAFDYRVYGSNSHHYEPQFFGQSEHRSDNQVSGEYHVQLPNGRVQHVRYYVSGDSGFVADVSFADSMDNYQGPRSTPDSMPRHIPDGYYNFNPYEKQ